MSMCLHIACWYSAREENVGHSDADKERIRNLEVYSCSLTLLLLGYKAALCH